jgi:hypothetical protein
LKVQWAGIFSSFFLVYRGQLLLGWGGIGRVTFESGVVAKKIKLVAIQIFKGAPKNFQFFCSTSKNARVSLRFF